MNLQIRDSENNKVFIDDFSFRPPSLTIYSGTTVEFIIKNNTSIHRLGCKNEFSGIDMNNNNRSYKHRFLSIGYYEVQNEVFSFMICRITVIECTKVKCSSPLDDIASTGVSATVKINPTVNDKVFVAATDSTVNPPSSVHPIDTIHRIPNTSIITTPLTIDTAIQATDIQCQAAFDTMKFNTNHSPVVPSTITAMSSKPCIIASNSTHHLLHGSFATDTDPSKRINGNTNTVNIDLDESADVTKEIPAESDYMSTADINGNTNTVNIDSNESVDKEIPAESNYMSTADIGTSIIAAMWKTSKSLATPSKSIVQTNSKVDISTKQTSIVSKIDSTISTEIPHTTKTSTSIDKDIDKITPIVNESLKKNCNIKSSTQSMKPPTKSIMTSTMTSTMTFTTITTSTATTTTIPPPFCPSTLLPTSSSFSSFVPSSNGKGHEEGIFVYVCMYMFIYIYVYV